MTSKFKSILVSFYFLFVSTFCIIRCSKNNNTDGKCGISTSASGTIITNIKAKATGGGSPFGGVISTKTDLQNLVSTAWGDGGLDLHRGHAPVQAVLEAFLGITHANMHTMMEDCDMNLSAVCEAFGFNPENLVETLTASFLPYIEEGATKGVITKDEVAAWKEQVRAQFKARVYWKG
jgi:hypothetical protein